MRTTGYQQPNFHQRFLMEPYGFGYVITTECAVRIWSQITYNKTTSPCGDDEGGAWWGVGLQVGGRRCLTNAVSGWRCEVVLGHVCCPLWYKTFRNKIGKAADNMSAALIIVGLVGLWGQYAAFAFDGCAMMGAEHELSEMSNNSGIYRKWGLMDIIW